MNKDNQEWRLHLTLHGEPELRPAVPQGPHPGSGAPIAWRRESALTFYAATACHVARRVHTWKTTVFILGEFAHSLSFVLVLLRAAGDTIIGRFPIVLSLVVAAISFETNAEDTLRYIPSLRNNSIVYSNSPTPGSKRETKTAIGTRAATLSARDQGNGEVLLEWPVQTNAIGYRVERTASGVPVVSLDAGGYTNAMDFAGLADTYSYRLLARAADGTEWLVSTLSYTSPAAVRTRATQAAGRPPQLRAALGTNLDPVTPWSPQVPFLDVMKGSTDWISGDSTHWDNGQALNLDADGWVRSLAPGQVAKKLMLREIGDRYPAGQYRVTYKGEGTLTFQFAARVVSQQPGEVLIQVTPDNNGIYLSIEATNPANYLRDIEVIMPGGICEGNPFTHVTVALDCGPQRYLSFDNYHRSILFYPVFAERLRAYSVLRFMDWMATNGSKVTSGSQRTPLTFHTWSAPAGVPIEVMIALANRMGAHPWFNMPHQSDDAYATTFAQTLKGRLDAALGVYVEYSNEVWNSMFPQYGYAVNQGAAQQPAIDNMQYYALRSRGVSRIFKDTLGAPRTVAVLGGQAVNPWTATWGLDYLLSRFGAGQSAIDAIAIAPYFAVMPNPVEAPTYTAMSLDTFFSYVRTQIVPQTTTDSATYRAAANRYGVHLISYEGGQHMVGVLGAENNDALSAMFDAFNRDPRIKDLYLTYLAGWKQAGGELFVHFNDVGAYTKWGRWGSMEYVTQPRTAAPKFDAIQSFIEQNPVWWKPGIRTRYRN